MTQADGGASADASSDPHDLFETADAVDLYVERARDPVLHEQERKAVERHFDRPDATVLDIGCGSGRVAARLHDRGFEVTGLDRSGALVAVGRAAFPELEFVVGDITDAPLRSGQFDYAFFAHYGLDYVLPAADRRAALAEIRRVLKPGGIAVVSSHNSWYLKLRLGLLRNPTNWPRLFSRRKAERVPLGEVDIYFASPRHQRHQFEACGFSVVDIVGKRESALRLFERELHFVLRAEGSAENA